MADSAQGISTFTAHKRQTELTAFVREVLLPGSGSDRPEVIREHCRFKLECRPSTIHRWGIFAAERIPSRRRVIEYTGQRISANEVWRRRFRKYIYIYWLPDGTALDGAIGGSGAQSINHSCRPNLVARIASGRIFLSSLRRIEAGEELLFDYHLANNGIDIPCSCGAPECRGIMNPPRQ